MTFSDSYPRRLPFAM
jgi:hypothetical protein